ncbi:GGDEF domain-containing protein [Algibacillus agarilyticus]|uniref:GGDEF domain-containing protein n=1 Tax=Algibacillus agarilyticus TaxID=2234133 RepID=UPI000DD01113|nr:diguanylate cyclase [Algibacillus agarilyticus]
MTDALALINNMRKNEEIAQKLFEIETQILGCKNSGQLFNTLFKSLQQKFNLGGVYLLLNSSAPISLLSPNTAKLNNQFYKQHPNIFSTSHQHFERFLKGVNITLTNRLHEVPGLLPASILSDFKSLANIPLYVEGKLFASLIFTDKAADRFHNRLGTYHLEQLAVKISLCITNVIAREQLEYLASHDPLTGIKNRRCLAETIKSEISRYKRYNNPFSIIFIDCNKFKQINDTYGHECGDQVLQYIAQTLSQQIRECDDVFRYAGDEFVVTLSNQTLNEGQQVALRLQTYFDTHSLVYNEHKLQPSISCGVAQCMQDDHIDPLLKRADDALYQQKHRLNPK